RISSAMLPPVASCVQPARYCVLLIEQAPRRRKPFHSLPRVAAAVTWSLPRQMRGADDGAARRRCDRRDPCAIAAATGWRKRLVQRFLRFVEWLGNLLPHPVTLFAIFALTVVLVSGIAEYFDLSVVDPRPEGAAGRAPDGRIYAISLLNADGLRR